MPKAALSACSGLILTQVDGVDSSESRLKQLDGARLSRGAEVSDIVEHNRIEILPLI